VWYEPGFVTSGASPQLEPGAPDLDVDLVARIRGFMARTTADEVLASLFLAWVLFVSWKRLAYGVDFSDESFAVAITQRYALGDRPYIDELNLRQTGELLPVPLYWAYLKIVGSTDGVVHFLRVLFFAVQCLVGLTVYQLGARRIPRAVAIVAAALPIAFVPFCVPMCNYNNLGTMMLALGVFTGLRALLDDPRPRAMMLAGACHGLACIAYPPLAVPVIVFGVVTRFVPGRPRAASHPWDAFRSFVIGLAIVGVPFALILLPGLSGLRHALHYESMTTRPRTLDKVKGVIHALGQISPANPASLTTLAALGLVAKQAPRFRKYVLAAIVVYVAHFFSETPPELRALVPTYTLSLHLVIYLGLLAGFFIVFLEWSDEARVMLWAGWVPCVVAGMVIATSSDNVGCMNGGLGLFPAAALAMILAPMAALRRDERDDGEPPAWLTRTALAVAMAVVPLAIVSVNVGITYSDGPITPEFVRVESGPFRGLRGTAAKAARAEELTRELRALVQPGDHMLSYYDFPGAYLSTPARPGMQTVWTDRRAKLEVLLPYWQAHRTGRGVVLVLPGSAGTSPQLEALTEVPERLIVDRGWFRIYREPPP
jgi:hypothetical protein